MVRRTTHLALVVLAVLVATGPSALVLADADRATGTDPGVAAAVGPLDATGDLADENLTADETTDTNLTEENATDENLTDENLTDDENPTEEETVENETVADETTDATETVTDETPANTTDIDVTADADATTGLESRAPDATNAVENATSATDGTGLAGGVDTIDDAVGGVTEAKPEAVSLDSTASASLLDAEDVGDAPLEDGDADDAESDDGESDSGKSDDSDPATDQERRAENETTTAAGAGDAGTDDEKGVNPGPSPDRDRPGGPPSSAEAVAGVGALTAAALFPQLADGLTLVGNVGALSAASSAAVSSQSSNALQGDFDRLWRTATAFRYSRHDDSDPLAHETRVRLHETVERSPGAYLSAICERADVAVSTARHHLDVLEDEGLVATAKVRGKRRYFPAHSDDVELAAALEDDANAAVLRALARLGDSHGGRLADELDRDPSTVSHHLSRLEDAGLVERERAGRAVVNRLAPAVERTLDAEESKEERRPDAEAPAIAD